jgi:hypothetical protein
VRAKAELEFADTRDRVFGNVFCSACAAPFSLTDKAAAGVMIVGLPDGYPSGYLSWPITSMTRVQAGPTWRCLKPTVATIPLTRKPC